MLDEAMREFRRVSELREHDVEARFYIGLALMRQNKWSDAVAAFRECVSHPGARPAAYHNLAGMRWSAWVATTKRRLRSTAP